MRAPRLRRFYGTQAEAKFADGLRFMESAARLLLDRDLTAEESWGLDEWLGQCFSNEPSVENELLKSIQGQSFMEKQPQGEGA